MRLAGNTVARFAINADDVDSSRRSTRVFGWEFFADPEGHGARRDAVRGGGRIAARAG
jgi:hypothetical protein